MGTLDRIPHTRQEKEESGNRVDYAPIRRTAACNSV